MGRSARPVPEARPSGDQGADAVRFDAGLVVCVRGSYDSCAWAVRAAGRCARRAVARPDLCAGRAGAWMGPVTRVAVLLLAIACCDCLAACRSPTLRPPDLAATHAARPVIAPATRSAAQAGSGRVPDPGARQPAQPRKLVVLLLHRLERSTQEDRRVDGSGSVPAAASRGQEGQCRKQEKCQQEDAPPRTDTHSQPPSNRRPIRWAEKGTV